MKNNKMVSLYHHIVPLVLCTAFFTFNPVQTAQAQDWRLEPIFKAGVAVEDNARLSTRTDEEIDLTGALLEARADIYYASDTTSFFLQPRALIRTYPGVINVRP